MNWHNLKNQSYSKNSANGNALLLSLEKLGTKTNLRDKLDTWQILDISFWMH